MSKILALAFAATLLGVSACNKPSEESSQPVAAQPAPQTSAAPAPADAMMTAPADEKPAMTAKQTESGAGKMSMPIGEMKPAPAAPAVKAEAPVVEAPAAKPAEPAASSGILTQDQALALAQKGNCLSCHKIERRVVGPAWKDVGAKYKGDKNAAVTIASHIKSGGSFGWKFGVMPARGGSKISDADVDSLAKFIASLK